MTLKPTTHLHVSDITLTCDAKPGRADVTNLYTKGLLVVETFKPQRDETLITDTLHLHVITNSEQLSGCDRPSSGSRGLSTISS